MMPVPGQLKVGQKLTQAEKQEVANAAKTADGSIAESPFEVNNTQQTQVRAQDPPDIVEQKMQQPLYQAIKKRLQGLGVSYSHSGFNPIAYLQKSGLQFTTAKQVQEFMGLLGQLENPDLSDADYYAMAGTVLNSQELRLLFSPEGLFKTPREE